MDVSDKYIDNLRGLPKNYIWEDEIYEQAINEEDFDKKMEERDKIYDSFDNKFYGFGNKEIEDKILEYLREHYFDFFVFLD